MPARKKTLRDFVADGTFLARRPHHLALLADSDPLGDPVLDRLQADFLEATDGLERQQLAREYQRAVKDGAGDRGVRSQEQLKKALAELGPRGSAEQVINFAPRFLKWDDGDEDDEKTPFVLDPFQQAFVREAFRRESRRRETRRVYKEITLGIPRGNGKTPLATLLGLHALLTAPGRPKVFQAAGAGDQAKLGLEYASNWIDDSELAAYLEAGSSLISRRDGRGLYSIMRAAGGLGHGRKPTVGIIDEWWAFKDYAQTQTYTALESALHKLKHAYLIAISTAGYDKSSQLGQAFESAFDLPDVRTEREGFLTIARDAEAGRLFVWYGLPDGYELDLDNDEEILRAIKLANPGSWVDHYELLRAFWRARQKNEVNEWIRLALNGWTKVKGAWVPTGAWMALADDRREIPVGVEVYVAVDAAESYDTTAVCWAWKDPDSDRIVIRCRVWSVRDKAPAHEYVPDFYDSGRDAHVAELFIYHLAERYRIKEIVADPNYFRTELRRLARRFRTAPMYPQSKEMREAIQEFHRGIVERHDIAHDGDKVLRDHVDGVAGTKTIDGYWAIYKGKNPNPIDGCTAAIMAYSRAARAAAGADTFDVGFIDWLDADLDPGGTEDVDAVWDGPLLL